MKRLAILAVPLALAACSNFEASTGLTAEEQCALANTVILLAEINEVAPDTLARAKLNFTVFCPAGTPIPEPVAAVEG
jgi:heat shock protein HslJ